MCVIVVLATAQSALASPRLSLRADTQSQVVQNERADTDHLSRMKNQQMVERYARLRLLVPVPAKTRGYYLHNIPGQRRYLRPWSKLFLDRISRQYRARFGRTLRVTSLVRSQAYQKTLRRRNGNAASASGQKRSTHLTGASLDISKKGMTRAQVTWVRRVLFSLKQKGHLFAIEEYSQPNFHVMVYRNYPKHVERLLTAQNRRR